MKKKISDYNLLKHLRQTEFVRRIGENAKSLILSKKDFIDLKTNYCGICGKRKTDPVNYFGEDFCRACVEKLDPNDTYNKQLKGRRGFSRG